MEEVWKVIMAGGWFAGEMTLGLWFCLAAIILIPLSGITYCSDMPNDEKAQSGWRITLSMALFVGILAALQWGGIPLWNFIKTHALYVGVAVVLGLGIGIVWSHYKINLRAKRCSEAVHDLFAKFLEQYHLDPKANNLSDKEGRPRLTLEKQNAERWVRYFNDYRGSLLASSGVTSEELRMTFMKNKERIALWILFWPGSMLRGFFADIVVPAFEHLIMSMKGIYEGTMQRHAIEVTYTEPPTGSDGTVTPTSPADYSGSERVRHLKGAGPA